MRWRRTHWFAAIQRLQKPNNHSADHCVRRVNEILGVWLFLCSFHLNLFWVQLVLTLLFLFWPSLPFMTEHSTFQMWHVTPQPRHTEWGCSEALFLKINKNNWTFYCFQVFPPSESSCCKRLPLFFVWPATKMLAVIETEWEKPRFYCSTGFSRNDAW